MIFNNHDKLIAGAEKPRGFCYRAIIGYSSVVTLFIILSGLSSHGSSRLTLYFIINLFTVIIFTWFIRKSFQIISAARYGFFLRIELFFC
ncbi:MAG: hypothetical protein XXXJIFNMEKO3_00293 [Candidatus Erwinia impunctatus]|nr:hypothetical protein XXXJIFNMEKO_00293 [Culicoides impunctatus]